MTRKPRFLSDHDQSAIEDRRANIPPKYQQIYKAAAEGTASPRKAIQAHCLECCGYSRTDITNCSSHACPLFHYRPYQDD